METICVNFINNQKAKYYYLFELIIPNVIIKIVVSSSDGYRYFYS